MNNRQEVSHEESEPPQEDKPPSPIPLIQKAVQLRQRNTRSDRRVRPVECRDEIQRMVGYLNRQRISGLPFI